MELTLKVQKIPENPIVEGNCITLTHEFEVPDETHLKKRGKLFITMSIEASQDFDLENIAKLFIENLKENFYRITEDTPLHCIEKALSRAHKIIQTVKSRDERINLGSVESRFRISFATALVWNRVLYTSYYGNPAVYLIRGSGVRNLAISPAQDEIWTSSAILDDDDVVIIGTDEFAKEFPPQEIINQLGSLSQLIGSKLSRSCISTVLIKISAKDTQTKQTSGASLLNSKFRDAISAPLVNIASRIRRQNKLHDKFKPFQNKKSAPVSSINSLIGNTPGAASTSSISARRINQPKVKARKQKQIFIGLIMLTLIGYANFKLVHKTEPFKPEDINSQLIAEDDLVMNSAPGESAALVQGVSDTADTAENANAFINLNAIGGGINPIEIATTGKNLMVIDSKQNALVKITLENQGITKVRDGYTMPRLLSCDIDVCFTLDNRTLKVGNPDTPDKDDDTYLVDMDGITDIYPYSNSVYILTVNNIHSIRLGANAPQAWLSEDESIESAKSIAVDGDIYLLSGREILKYRSGKQMPAYSVSGGSMINPTQIDVSNTEIYVLDASEQKNVVHVFDKIRGTFKKEINLDGAAIGDAVTLFTVTKPSGTFRTPQIIYESNGVIYKIDPSQ